MREKYESLSLAVLREVAKSRGLKKISTLKKAELVEAMLAEDARVAAEEAEEKKKEKPVCRERHVRHHAEDVSGRKAESEKRVEREGKEDTKEKNENAEDASEEDFEDKKEKRLDESDLDSGETAKLWRTVS